MFRTPVQASETPYVGRGELVILDDATLILTVLKPRPEGQETLDRRGKVLDRVAYDLDIAKLSLIEHDGQVFLDKDGLQLLRRGLSADDVRVIEFENIARVASQEENYVLDSFAGDLQLQIDDQTGALLVSMTDAETERHFSVTLRAKHTVEDDSEDGDDRTLGGKE